MQLKIPKRRLVDAPAMTKWTLLGIVSLAGCGGLGDRGVDAAGAEAASDMPAGAMDASTPEDLALPTEKHGCWTILTLQAPGGAGAGHGVSLALDKGGAAHISHYDKTLPAVRYTTNVSGSFRTETVEAVDTVVHGTAIAIDPAGAPHVGYESGKQFGDSVAIRTGGRWVAEGIKDASGPPALAIDGTGLRQTVWFFDDFSTESVIYLAAKQGEAWTRETVATAGTGRLTRAWIALSASGAPTVALERSGTIIAATRANGAWHIENVLVGHSSDTSVAIDRDGHAHVASTQGMDFDIASMLIYSSNVSGSWVNKTVSMKGYNSSPAIQVDGSGAAHIAFVEEGKATWISNRTGSWVEETVDAAPSANTTLALDDKGQPHIAYRSTQDGSLKYASCAF